MARCFGNRADRMLACVAYLDGGCLSAVMCRGYYGRSVLAASAWRGGQLTGRWVFLRALLSGRQSSLSTRMRRTPEWSLTQNSRPSESSLSRDHASAACIKGRI